MDILHSCSSWGYLWKFIAQERSKVNLRRSFLVLVSILFLNFIFCMFIVYDNQLHNIKVCCIVYYRSTNFPIADKRPWYLFYLLLHNSSVGFWVWLCLVSVKFAKKQPETLKVNIYRKVSYLAFWRLSYHQNYKTKLLVLHLQKTVQKRLSIY